MARLGRAQPFPPRITHRVAAPGPMRVLYQRSNPRIFFRPRIQTTVYVLPLGIVGPSVEVIERPAFAGVGRRPQSSPQFDHTLIARAEGRFLRDLARVRSRSDKTLRS